MSWFSADGPFLLLSFFLEDTMFLYQPKQRPGVGMPEPGPRRNWVFLQDAEDRKAGRLSILLTEQGLGEAMDPTILTFYLII